MKTTYALFLLSFVLASPAAKAADHCKNEAIEPLVKRFAQAWETKQLGSLDNERPYLGSIQFVVEHSIADNYEVEEKTNLETIEQWLRSQESEGFPVREARPLLWCKKGLCVFDFSAGIAHNHRYIQKVTYEKKMVVSISGLSSCSMVIEKLASNSLFVPTPASADRFLMSRWRRGTTTR